MSLDGLEKEMEIVLYFSKLTFNQDEVCKVREIVEKGVNWEKIIRYADRNRTLYVVLNNFFRCELKECVPNWLEKLVQDSFICNALRNDEKLNELENISIELQKRNIKTVPVKGAYLIDAIYNRKIRTTNDIDILIMRKDIPVIKEVMQAMGYTDEHYNFEKKCFEPVSAQMKMLYKMKMYNLLPYAKEGKLGNMIFFDFSHSLDFSLNSNVVEEMINNSLYINGKHQLLPEHFLLHMCCHHYREASHTEWIKLGKDLNLMKFCDVREFVLQKTNDEILKRMIQFAHKYFLEKPVYFTFYFLNKIYADGYEDNVLKNLNILNTDFIFEYGENEYEAVKRRNKSFWRSFFDEDNKDELSERPHYERITNE